MIDYQGLVRNLAETHETFGLLTQQASPTASILHAVFPDRLKALFSAEHGFFGTAAPGEETASTWHPFYNVPIHSLYGKTRRPTDEMLAGLGRIIIDLRDIGVRCYTYLATLRNVVEECAARGIPVTVLDVPIPLGGILDGPMRRDEFESFVAPLNVPLCHGMTPGECATWIKENEHLQLDLTVIRVKDWDHHHLEPWMNFVAPSPAIKSWDSAALYPMLVFTEAYPAIDCDRSGTMPFRVIGAPWLDRKGLMHDLAPGLAACGVGMRPYRYAPTSGSYANCPLNGIMFSIESPGAFYPVTAGVLIFTALLQHHAEKMSFGARPEWLDKLMGSTDIRDTMERGQLSDLFRNWIDAQDAYLTTRVNLY
jgi:uncharacterized protein YbbC (DUF1343 family)